MKKILFFFLFVTPFYVIAQSVTADPALNQMGIYNLTNSNVVITQSLINSVVKLKVPILNRNVTTPLPAGTCKIKIGLGSKLEINPTFSLHAALVGNYFAWTSTSTGGQVLITGDLIGELPANFSDFAEFELKGTTLGVSTMTTNFLVTNHNSSIYLSDENGNNNNSSLPYSIVNTILPVTFTNIATEKKDCSLKLIFDTENEINVSKYELEISKESSGFEKIASVQANNLKRYNFNFDLTEVFKIPVLFVRVKSVDFDGRYQYSDIQKISGICEAKVGLSLYPNPVPTNAVSTYIEKEDGTFNGNYVIAILDMVGRQIQTKELKLTNVKGFNYNIGNIARGQYLIKILKKDTNSLDVLKLIRQ